MSHPPTERTHGYTRPVLLLLVTAAALAFLALVATPGEAEVVDLPVPYHRQVESWYCAEASLKMVFDYWGEEITQHDIGDVANERSVGGTYTTDMARAARFSNMCQSLQYREGGGARLQGYDQRSYGYAAHVHQWTGSGHFEDRYTDLMDLVRQGYPVILLSWLDANHDVTHYRIVKGFDTDTGDFLVHDPALGSDLRFNPTLLVDDLWTYNDRWGMVVAPWAVEVTVPDVVGPGAEFTVEAKVTYPCPSPFDEVEKVYTWPEDARASITVPPPFSLAAGENASRDLNMTRGGDVDTLNWTVVSPVEVGYWTADIGVMAEATVTDYAISYGWYTDRAGGVGTVTVGCDAMPPTIVSLSIAEGAKVLNDPKVPVAYITSDAHSSVARVVISIDGGLTWRDLEGPSGGLDIDLDLGDGNYDIRFTVEDAVGNSASETRSLVLDTTGPRISLFQLAGGAEILTTPIIQVTLSAEDATTGIDLMSLRIGDSQWGVWEPYREELQVTLPSDGEFRVDVRLRDLVGNTASASDSVTVDTVAPYITRYEVARGLMYSQTSTVEVVFSAGDGSGSVLEWSLHEETVGVAQFDPERFLASGDTRTMDWTFQGEGTRTLILVVRDPAGHTSDATANLVVDTQPPLLTLVLNGGKDITTVSDIPVAVSVMDATTEVTKARIRVNSNEWGPWSDPGVFRRVDLGPEEGERTVFVQAQDLAGNLAEASDSVLVDTMVPTVSVSFTRTRPGGVVLGESSILLVFSEPMATGSVGVVLMDNSSGVVACAVEWTVNGTELQVDPKGSFPRGSHFVLQVSGQDTVGNQLDFPGVIFSTPEAEGDDWDAVLPGDSNLLLLLVAMLLVGVVMMAYGMARKKGER